MTGMLRKMTGMLLTGAMVMGVSVTALAAEEPSSQPPASAREAAKPKVAPEQKQALQGLRSAMKDLHEKIGAQRTELKGKLETIKSLVQALRQDPEKNKAQLMKAKASLNELRALRGDIKSVNGRLQAKHAELRAAIQARDAAGAVAAAKDLVTLMQTKLDLLRTANNVATQAIAHLNGAGEGNAE